MTEGYGQMPARATADRLRQDTIQAACTACVNSAALFWWLTASWGPEAADFIRTDYSPLALQVLNPIDSPSEGDGFLVPTEGLLPELLA